MLDEPFAGVDPKSIYELKKIFVDISNKGIAILISDHHADQLLSFAQRAYVIINGLVVTVGNSQDVIENTLTKEIYLGNQFYQEISQRFNNKTSI
jgi:lipopolysaccharide export system ATP-binding protein